MQKFFLHPSWAIIVFSLGVLVGDILIHVFRFTFFASGWWILVAILALVLSVKMSSWLTLPLAFLAGFLMLSFRATPDFMAQESFQGFLEHKVVITGTIMKDVDVSEGKTTLVIKDLVVDEEEYSGKVYVSLPALSKIGASGELHRSDRVTFEGKLSPGFGTFLAYMYRPKLIAVTRPEPGDFFLTIRDGLATQIREYIPEEEAGLALGYLLGIRGGVGDEFEETLRTVGLTHIIVASGTHLSILVEFARKIFGRFSRFSSLFFALFFVAVFVGITGMTPSMTRAALVTFLSLVTWYFGRKFEAWRLLLIAVALTLLVAPMNLLDLAWLLSFASFAGIMLLAPALMRFFFGTKKKPNFIGETILASLSAAVLCTPILIYFYGSVSLISIFANVLILPTISVVLGLTLAVGLFACVGLTPMAWLIGQAVTVLLKYHIGVVNFLGEQKYFLVSFGTGSPVIFSIYAILALGWLVRFIVLRRRRRRLVLTPENDTG